MTSHGDEAHLDEFVVGQRYDAGTVAVDAEAIKAFAAAFDPQPFHVSEVAAEASPFGRLVASGWHTAALTMRQLVEAGRRPAWGLIGLAVDEMRWPRPVEPGDVLHVQAEVLEVRRSRSKPDRGTVRLRVTTTNQRGEVVLGWITTVLVPRRTREPAQGRHPAPQRDG